MDKVDPSTLAFVLCTQRDEEFYISPELLRLILLLAGKLGPTNVEELGMVPDYLRREKDIYRFDCPQYFLKSYRYLYECIEFDAVKCLQLYIDRGLSKDGWVCESAARRGRRECLRLLIANNFPKSRDACVLAAENGHLECLRLLIANNFPKSREACILAAENGHLECLRLLIANDFPKDRRACVLAARKGHSECYRFLIANGFPH